MKIILLSLCVFFGVAFSASDADPRYVTVCDAFSPLWGCEPQFWYKGERTLCLNTTNLMSWATKPSRSSCYEIYEETRSTTYNPSEIVTLNIQVKCYKKQYRGILVYAVDENGYKVGDWEITGEEPPLYKRPWTSPDHSCYGSLMHASAQNKPYHTRIYYKAPKAGTGAITFRALIKVSVFSVKY